MTCSLTCVVMGKAEGKGEHWHGHVTAITVAPEFRRVGLAKSMMEWLEMVSEEVYNGYFVDLFVRVSNNVATGMYEGMGYRVYREVIEYYSGMDGNENAYGEWSLSGRWLCASPDLVTFPPPALSASVALQTCERVYGEMSPARPPYRRARRSCRTKWTPSAGRGCRSQQCKLRYPPPPLLVGIRLDSGRRFFAVTSPKCAQQSIRSKGCDLRPGQSRGSERSRLGWRRDGVPQAGGCGGWAAR